jgi:hypothetical protein
MTITMRTNKTVIENPTREQILSAIDKLCSWHDPDFNMWGLVFYDQNIHEPLEKIGVRGGRKKRLQISYEKRVQNKPEFFYWLRDPNIDDPTLKVVIYTGGAVTIALMYTVTQEYAADVLEYFCQHQSLPSNAMWSPNYYDVTLEDEIDDEEEED